MLYKGQSITKLIKLLSPLTTCDKPIDLRIYLDEELYAILSQVNKEKNLQKITGKDISEIITKLDGQAKIAITLAFVPTVSQIDQLISKFETTQGPTNDYSVEINYDPNIIAGLVIMVNGRVYDYSYKQKFLL